MEDIRKKMKERKRSFSEARRDWQTDEMTGKEGKWQEETHELWLDVHTHTHVCTHTHTPHPHTSQSAASLPLSLLPSVPPAACCGVRAVHVAVENV